MNTYLVEVDDGVVVVVPVVVVVESVELLEVVL